MSRARHEHGGASNDAYRRKASLEGRDDASSGLGLVALVLDKGVLELERGESSKDRHNKDVDVGNEDDSTLVGDSSTHASAGEGSPLVDVKNLQRAKSGTAT